MSSTCPGSADGSVSRSWCSRGGARRGPRRHARVFAVPTSPASDGSRVLVDAEWGRVPPSPQREGGRSARRAGSERGRQDRCALGVGRGRGCCCHLDWGRVVKETVRPASRRERRPARTGPRARASCFAHRRSLRNGLPRFCCLPDSLFAVYIACGGEPGCVNGGTGGRAGAGTASAGLRGASHLASGKQTGRSAVFLDARASD